MVIPALAVLSAALLLVTTLLWVRLVRRTEAAESRFEQLVRDAPDMIVSFDLQGRFIDVNPATLEQSGYTFAELKALPNTAFFPEDDYRTLLTVLAEMQAGSPVRALTVRYRRKDGEERWISVRATPIDDPARGGAILCIAHDVTDDVMRTQALRRSEERFRSLVSAFDRAFFVQDPDGRFAGVFGRWLRSAAIEPAKFLGRTAREIHAAPGAEAEAERHEAAFAKVMAGQDATYEGWWQTVAGERRLLRVSMSPMRDPSGRIIGAAGVAADVTRRVQAEEESAVLRRRVAEAERIEALGKLVSGVAHELNNPLAAILNFTEDLLLDTRDPDDRAALEIIQAQALRSRTIVRDLLTFVRRGHERPRVVQAPGPIMDALLRALRPGLPVGVRLRTSLEDGDTPLDIDRAGFEQVLTNLITNAAQAAPTGHVWVKARRTGDAYEVRVEDDGTGIKPEHVTRLFEPFFSTKPVGQGVGLGLSVSLGIMQQHGGMLEGGNREEGPGARFVMRLPVSREPVRVPTPPAGSPQAEQAALAAQPGASGQTPRRRASLTPVPGVPTLLVVDDEAPIRRALRRYFERRGWVVDEAEDGSDALALLSNDEAATRFDVVLCDLKMPGLSGPELYEKLRASAPEILPRIIFVTGDVTGEAASSFLGQVSGPVLEKPFELATVGQVAEELRTSLAAGR
jgi:PAS domain S-box-containing protein